VRIAVIGDVHLSFGDADVRHLNGAGYDLVAFVGDLAGYRHGGGVEVARAIGALRGPTLVIPGNHDATHVVHLAAEAFLLHRLRGALGGRQHRRAAALRRALGPAELCGYSVHPFETHGLSVIAARPHTMGGPHLAFRRYLQQAHGVSTLEQSAARLCALVDRAPHERIVFLAHNGPTGLGGRRDDIWGCDFRREEGDFGDEDLRLAIAHARASGRRVLAVLAGHMHHAVKGGGVRRWQLERDGVLYVNAARVPRIFRENGRLVRHHVRVSIEGDGATAEPVLVQEPGGR
jgi:uncharacterized protein (TIGR04168 family)